MVLYFGALSHLDLCYFCPQMRTKLLLVCELPQWLLPRSSKLWKEGRKQEGRDELLLGFMCPFPGVPHPSSSLQPCPTLSHAAPRHSGHSWALCTHTAFLLSHPGSPVPPPITLEVLHSPQVFSGRNPGLLLGKTPRGFVVCRVPPARPWRP